MIGPPRCAECGMRAFQWLGYGGPGGPVVTTWSSSLRAVPPGPVRCLPCLDRIVEATDPLVDRLAFLALMKLWTDP